MKNNVILKLENITLSYKTRQQIFKTFEHKALDNVSFTVNKGEVLGLIGNNGAGKSTLLKVIAGVLSPDSGQIIMPKDTTCALLSLGLGFNNDLSGRDNVILSAMFNGYSKKEAIELSEEIKDFADIGPFFEQPVRSYSSGMRSRVGFASGIISDVDILLIDEVLSVGDANFRKKAESAMLNKLGGEQTVIFVSHSIHQIKKICDRTIDLSNNQKETIIKESD